MHEAEWVSLAQLFFFTTRRNRLSVQANGSVDEAKDKLSPFASDVLEVKFASEIEGFFAERKIITVPILHVPAGISRERIYLPNALVILLLRMFRVKGTFEVEEEKQLMRPKVANARYISRRPVCLRNSEINRVDAAQCTASSPIFFALPFCHTYQRVSFSRQLDCAGNIIWLLWCLDRYRNLDPTGLMKKYYSLHFVCSRALHFQLVKN